MENTENTKHFKWMYISIFIIVLLVIGYAGILLWLTRPIDQYSISKAGAFGDSFGILTSLFSGTAFAVLIVTIYLQKSELTLQRMELNNSVKELALQREELKNSALAQNKNAKLSALATLLTEYKSQILSNQEISRRKQETATNKYLANDPVENETNDLIRRKGIIITEIENSLEEYGVYLAKKKPTENQ